jgi:hypothetical protein
VISKTYFVSRQAFRTSYATQRECELGRAQRRAQEVLQSLGGSGASDEAYYLRKPKWMRWRTFERKMAIVREADETWNREMLRRFGHVMW